MICTRCRRDQTVGTHGVGHCPLEPQRGAVVKPDTLIGGFLAENAWTTPRYFDSQRAYERALDADGMMLKPKRVAGDAIMDPQTLENARILVSRGQGIASRPTVTLETWTQTARVLDSQMRVR